MVRYQIAWALRRCIAFCMHGAGLPEWIEHHSRLDMPHQPLLGTITREAAGDPFSGRSTVTRGTWNGKECGEDQLRTSANKMGLAGFTCLWQVVHGSQPRPASS